MVIWSIKKHSPLWVLQDRDYQLARRIQNLINEGDEDGASELDSSIQFVYPKSNQPKSVSVP